jgi:hypothetical protein
MTLRIVNDTHEMQVGNDLAHIVGTADNAHLGLTPGTGTDTVTYAQTVHDTVNDRMNALINGFASNPIVIQGVDSTFVLADGNPVNQVAGETIVNPADVNASGTGLNAGAVVNIVYDVDACSGSGYFVFDTAGNHISFTTEVCLYHELAHAFHWVNNDFSAAAPEPQAETDENDLRAKEGVTARDVTNHAGGCGAPGGTPPPKNCFIVSAAYGSPHAAEVRAFQRVRDELVRAAPVGDRFFDRLMRDYYTFSRPLAARIESRRDLRAPVAAFVVAPLLAHLTTLQACAGLRWDARCDEIAATTVAGSLDAVRAAGADRGDVAEGARTLRAIAAAPDLGPPAPAPSTPRSPAGVFRLIAEGLPGRLHPASPAAWGLVAALRDAWSSLDALSAAGDATQAGHALVGRLRTWLVTAPLAPVVRDCAFDEAVEGMAALAGSVYTCPAMRMRVGAALLGAAGARDADRVAAILLHAGYETAANEETRDGR